ncbi:MAG: hypothetical protein BSOLF_2714 [Candidatus Carbobacillus altaicus]|uniref:Uncharacterized protein n=1 Tax=Candidatus Carbonibacillus altaicus TaxID=2163959 RepID=A0A2R6Y231_9BACL|nr:MAG: hypothetical protein BSOLF_2714 [Candidatus Carbobacillus altaicus]
MRRQEILKKSIHVQNDRFRIDPPRRIAAPSDDETSHPIFG